MMKIRMTSYDKDLTDSGALRTLFFLKAINRFGVERREEIRQIIETIDFERYDEADILKTLEKGIKKT